MPVAKSISRLPSTSSMIAPDARAVTIGWVLNTPCGTAVARRSNHSRDLGPGISVTTLRSCGMSTVPPRLLARLLARPVPRWVPAEASATGLPHSLASPGRSAFGTDHRSRPGGPHRAGFGILWPARPSDPSGSRRRKVRSGWATRRPTRCTSAASGRTPRTGRPARSSSPANGEVIAEVPEASAEDVDRAVAAARKTFDETWSDATPGERSRALLQDGRPGRGARATSSGASSPRTSARSYALTMSEEIPVIADQFRFFAGGRAGPRRAARPAST